MITLNETEMSSMDVCGISEEEETRLRLMCRYPMFLKEMKARAVLQQLSQELPFSKVIDNPDFLARIQMTIEDTALIDKTQMFLSVAVGE